VSRLRIKQRASALLLLVVLGATHAHHAPTEYDFSKIVEIEGTIVEVKWQNPHVTLKIRERDDAGNITTWDIEGSGVSMLRRSSAAAVRPRFQEKVRVAGHPSRRAGNRIFGLNLLLASGQELVFHPEGTPRWKSHTIGGGGKWFDADAEASGKGIFRVWSTKLDDPWVSGIQRDHLTQAAKDKLSSWDPVTDAVTVGCEPVGIPMLMANPYPIEFVQRGDRIVLRFELYDLERVIHMSPGINRHALPKSLLGRSIGRWDGKSLTVTTDGMTWSYLEYDGTPMSSEASMVERFTPSADGTRLSHSVTVTDPKYLSKPVTLERSWVARPNESVKPYKCAE
jgi:Family of unknown function (DUF6152)